MMATGKHSMEKNMIRLLWDYVDINQIADIINQPTVQAFIKNATSEIHHYEAHRNGGTEIGGWMALEVEGQLVRAQWRSRELDFETIKRRLVACTDMLVNHKVLSEEAEVNLIL